MAEHAETMAAEGVGSLDDLRLVTEDAQLQALGKPPPPLDRGCANVLAKNWPRWIFANILRPVQDSFMGWPERRGAWLRRCWEGDAPDQAPQGHQRAALIISSRKDDDDKMEARDGKPATFGARECKSGVEII